MRRTVDPPPLEDLKTRGEAALAETRRIVEEMRSHAEESMREAMAARRTGRR